MIRSASKVGTAIILAFAMPLLSCARPAAADMVARFVAEDGPRWTMTVYVGTADRWRVEDLQGDVTIARDGKVFVLVHDLPNKPPLLMRKDDFDAATAAREFEIARALKLPPPPPDEKPMIFDIVEGKEETVGGWNGPRYAIRLRDAPGGGATMGDMVVSRDPALAALGKALAAYLGAPDPQPEHGPGSNLGAKRAEIARKGCLVRFNGMRLEMTGPGPVDPRLFELPGTPLSRAAVDDVVRRLMPITDLGLIGQVEPPSKNQSIAP